MVLKCFFFLGVCFVDSWPVYLASLWFVGSLWVGSGIIFRGFTGGDFCWFASGSFADFSGTMFFILAGFESTSYGCFNYFFEGVDWECFFVAS